MPCTKHSMLRAALLRSSRAATSKLVASTSRPWTIRGLATSASTQAAAVPYKTHTSKNGVLAHTFFHDATSTWQYLVADDLTKTAVLIDPVLDFDAATLKVTTDTADSLVGFLQQNKYQLRHILETHAHADHLTAAQYFKTQFQAPVGIGAGILAVQKRAAADYDIPADELQGVFDNLWENGQTFQLGRNELAVMHLPGHTPDHVGYRCDNFVFVGDSLFLPDVGSARADFPGGSVVDLYASAQKLLALPDDVRIFSGHDYPGEDRHHSCSSTVAEQRELNKHLRHGTDEKEFSSMRARRDATLAAPRLLHQSLQVNLRGGNMPRPNAAGHQLMKLPIKF